MHESVPIGKDDSENVEIQKYGEPIVPDYEIPFHGEILETLGGLDLDSARRVSGNGFYYLMGDIARLHSAVLTYARDFMIKQGFTYRSSPSILYIIASISSKLITPFTTSLLIINGGIQYINPLLIIKSLA